MQQQHHPFSADSDGTELCCVLIWRYSIRQPMAATIHSALVSAAPNRIESSPNVIKCCCIVSKDSTTIAAHGGFRLVYSNSQKPSVMVPFFHLLRFQYTKCITCGQRTRSLRFGSVLHSATPEACMPHYYSAVSEKSKFVCASCISVNPESSMLIRNI